MKILTEFWPLTVWNLLAVFIVTLCIWSLLRYGENKVTQEKGKIDRQVSTLAAILLIGWATIVVFLGWNGIFEANEGTLFPFIALGVAVPLAVGCLFLLRSRKLALVLEHVPQGWLVSVQLYRALGAIFLILFWAGKLPGVFALPAGIGDVFVGLTAPVVAYLYILKYRRACLAILTWNAIGILDLLLAITLGFLSSPSPFQGLVLESPNTMISSFPLVLIPTFAVPFSIILHLASLQGLRVEVRKSDRVGSKPIAGRLAGCQT